MVVAEMQQPGRPHTGEDPAVSLYASQNDLLFTHQGQQQ